MMLTRDKRIGKSTYRIVKVTDRAFAIQETREGQTAVTPPLYTMEQAIPARKENDSTIAIKRAYRNN